MIIFVLDVFSDHQCWSCTVSHERVKPKRTDGVFDGCNFFILSVKTLDDNEDHVLWFVN